MEELESLACKLGLEQGRKKTYQGQCQVRKREKIKKGRPLGSTDLWGGQSKDRQRDWGRWGIE